MTVANVGPFTNVACPACDKHTRVKRQFGHYTLVRRHAVGGMSMVFVAHDNTLDREVAMKILSEEFSSDGRRIAAFEEEARITASFSHPNVVRVLTTGKAFGRLYIAMELVPGGHFEHQIRVRGKIPEIEMLPFAIEVAEGLKAAHAAGLIHRDIKPGNILLDAEGHAKIVDFGLALVTHGGKAQAKEIWATPYYVPPETIEGHPEDFRSDIYAFGATIYHALAGVPPCDEESMATNILREAKKRVIPLGQADPTLSEGICTIVDKAMAYLPDGRYGSYEEMIGQLHAALNRLKSATQRGAPETSENAAKRRALNKRKERMTLTVAGVVLSLAVFAGFWWVTRSGSQARTNKPVSDGLAQRAGDAGGGNKSASEIARSYREARADVEAGGFGKAAEEFAKLFENQSLQEPTRTWAGIEAVVSDYLDGESGKARDQAMATVEHVRSLPKNVARPGEILIGMLDRVQELPGISSERLDTSVEDAPHVMAWMLAGLKDWEQGLLTDAKVYLSAVAEADLSDDDSWLAAYQTLAESYLADAELLTGKVFQNLPTDEGGCRSAIAELDAMLGRLKTRGRARFNVRAWQLDLTKHAKMLVHAKQSSGSPGIVELAEVMSRLGKYADECRFADAAEFVKSLSVDPKGASRASLLAVSEASGMFLSNLEADLRKQAMIGDFALKAGGSVSKIAIDGDRKLTAGDAEGALRPVKWSDFSVDALISLHRALVASPIDEAERVKRHECAIAFDWLTGNHEHALAAAAVLAQGSATFKEHWEKIAKGLPK